MGKNKKSTELILKIDWDQLRKQKHFLIMVQTQVDSPTQADMYEGIIAMIDRIQDHAVDDLDIDDEVVFGKPLGEE